MSLLHSATALGDTELILRYLRQSYDVNRQLKHTGETPFLIACKDNRATIDILELLLSHGANPSAQSKDYQRTALHYAASAGNIEKIQFLISLGLNVNQRDTHGYTPLLLSALNPISNKKQVLQALLDVGATYQQKTKYGESAIRACASDFDLLHLFDREEVIAQLSWTELMLATVFGTLEDMQQAIEHDTNFSLRDALGRTVWHLAIATGDITKTSFLYQYDIPMGEQVAHYPNAFYAIRHDHVQMLKWLDSIGADLTVRTTLETVFTMASINNASNCLRQLLEYRIATQQHLDEALLVASSPQIAEILLDAGASINYKDGTGETALGNAIDIGYFDVAKYLLEKGSIPDLQYMGSTPLTMAVVNDDFRLVHLLLKSGANINYQTNPDMWFALQGVRSEKMLKLMLNHGADPNLSDAGGVTAHHEIAQWDENLATLLGNTTE